MFALIIQPAERQFNSLLPCSHCRAAPRLQRWLQSGASSLAGRFHGNPEPQPCPRPPPLCYLFTAEDQIYQTHLIVWEAVMKPKPQLTEI